MDNQISTDGHYAIASITKASSMPQKQSILEWHQLSNGDIKLILMFRHTLLIILRTFKRFKSSFLINLIGLSTGLACTLFVYLWVNDELMIDKFHANDQNIYQVMEFQKNSSSSIRVTNSTPGDLSATLATEFPEIEAAATATAPYWFDPFTLSIADRAVESKGIYVSKDYFKIFSFPLLHGDVDKVLADKNSIVITETTARALFNTTENLIGKAIEFQHEREFIISGILKDIPITSSLNFDIAMSLETFRDVSSGSFSWENSGPMTFVMLKNGTNIDDFNRKIENVIGKHIKEQYRTIFARKFSDIYLRASYNDKGEQSGGKIEYVVMFSLIALFILMIACINFMNLSTAKASRRIKEVGIKKSIGASRRILIYQYMGESMLMSFLSLLIAVLMVDLLLPQFNTITGKQLSMDIAPSVAAGFLAITFLTGLVAGSYPALYLSGFNPAIVLKGNLNSSVGEMWARKGLVVFQFGLSVVFIVSVLVIYQQIKFLQEKNLGYDKANLVYFQSEGKVQLGRETFLNELRTIPGVVSASTIGQSMVGGGNTTYIEWQGKA
ncbi:MAG: ABC transporter permease, partial [Chryseolinea sp.]